MFVADLSHRSSARKSSACASRNRPRNLLTRDVVVLIGSGGGCCGEDSALFVWLLLNVIGCVDVGRTIFPLGSSRSTKKLTSLGIEELRCIVDDDDEGIVDDPVDLLVDFDWA